VDEIPSFDCPAKGCNGKVFPVAMDGRFYIHRNMWINMPRTFVIPRCDTCAQDWFTKDLEVATNEVLEAEYQIHADMIKKVIQKAQAKVQ